MNPIRAWNHFFFGPISARPLGAFRVLLGLIALANLGFMSFDIDHWYTDSGLLHGSEAAEIAGPLRVSPLQWYQDATSVRGAFVATAVAAVLVTLGWRTRITSILLYIGMLSIHHRNVTSNCGADSLLIILLFCLMLSPSGAAFSLDAIREARRRGTPAEPLISPWAQRLIQIQIALVYLVAGILKCNGQSWFGGTAIHWVLQNAEVGRFRLDPLCEYPLAINALTHGALLVELALPILLWFRATRPWIILAGLGLHAGILFAVNIPIFGELMTAGYVAFLTPQELDAVLRRLDPRTWLSRRQRAAISGRVDGPAVLHGPHSRGGRGEPRQLTLFDREELVV